jgi:hypothetical protein
MIYRKRGSVARWENGTLVRVAESGMAIEKDELFECYPEASGDVPSVDESYVLETAHAVHDAAARAGVAIERLIVIEGIAEHEHTKAAAAAAALQNGWTEHSQRIHLSLIRARTRVILDLGSFDLDDVVRVADVLARAEETEREAPARLRLAPNVTAALLPSLIGIAPPNVRLVQTAGGVDGCGEPIVEAGSSEFLGGPRGSSEEHALSEELRGTRGPRGTPRIWPNRYRPSYRVRPVRMPLQLRLECGVTAIDADRPRAVALLAPVSVMNGQLVLRVLVADGDRAFPATVRVARIDAVSDERTWYPYGGGSFGAEMML